MSTPISIGDILSSVLTAITDALNTVISVITQNMSTFISIGIAVGLAGMAFALVRKFGRSITGWFRGLLRF